MNFSLEFSASLLCIFICERTNEVAFSHYKILDKVFLVIIIAIQLVLLHILIQAVVVSFAQSNFAELFDEVDILLVDLCSGYLLDFIEETVNRLKRNNQDDLLNEIVDGSHHFFVFTQLTLPEKFNDVFIKEIVTISAQQLQQRTRSFDNLNMSCWSEDKIHDLVVDHPLLDVSHTNRV